MRSLRRTGLLAIALAVVLVPFAGIATAKMFTGTAGDDTLNGTDRHDVIRGLAGNDTINGLGMGDLLRGGTGNDTIDGGDGHDKLHGGDGDDTLRGGNGNDIIFANVGVDTEYGGPGNDRLWAMARKDVTNEANEPTDTLNGEEGNDVFRVRDGEPDVVDCGDGTDRVFADDVDLVSNNCEVVQRRAPKKNENDQG